MKEWLEIYEKFREKTKSYIDFNEYFEKSEIQGKELAVMNIGICSIPSGEIVACDPLSFFLENVKPYLIKVPVGEYHTEVCVVKPDDYDCARYAAVRVKFTDKRAVKFYLAMTGNENVEELAELEEGEFFGFGVDAGMACVCDKVAFEKYCEFVKELEKDGENNIYDDYFAEMLEESYKQNPEFQREGGDWVNCIIPETEYHMPVFQSGFGDGGYPAYFGYDENDEICEIVISFIDIKMAYNEDDEEDF